MNRSIRTFVCLILALLLAAFPALAMTKERAEELVKAVDAKAQKARQFWVYPEGDGAWVFYGTGYNSKQALFKGGFWYVTEARQVQLGDYTENVLDWECFDCEPTVFYSCTLHGGNRHPHAAILKDGAPCEIQDFGTLAELDGYDGCLEGLRAEDLGKDTLHSVFLGVKDDRLVEIAAVPISEAQARRIPGMNAILKELEEGDSVLSGGIAATGFLYRNAAPGRFRNAKGNIQGTVTLLVDDHGTPGFVYLHIREDGTIRPDRGWESEIAIWEGVPLERYAVGLEIVETVME